LPSGLHALLAPLQQRLRNRQSHDITPAVAITGFPDMRPSLALHLVALIHSIDERIEKVAILPSQSHMKESLGSHQLVS